MARIDRYEQLKKQKMDRERGIINYIPLNYEVAGKKKGFSALARFVPGIIRGKIYGITANAGIGKSKFTRAFVKQIYDYVEQSQTLDCRILYFALEDSIATDFEDAIICLRLAQVHDIYISGIELNSMGYRELSDDVLEKIRLDKPWRDRFFSKVHVITSETNPTGMYKYCRQIALSLGTEQMKKVKVMQKDKSFKEEERFDFYAPNNKNMYLIAVVDYINILTPELRTVSMNTKTQSKDKRMLTQHQTIELWSTHYVMKYLTKNYGFAVINVIQQAADSEKQMFTRGTGQSVIEKVQPSLDGLGDNKKIARDHDVIFGLFAPHRYAIKEYKGWDITKMGRFYRELSILKNRFGDDYLRMNMLFEGASGLFKELPRIDHRKGAEKDKVTDTVNKYIEKIKSSK